MSRRLPPLAALATTLLALGLVAATQPDSLAGASVPSGRSSLTWHTVLKVAGAKEQVCRKNFTDSGGARTTIHERLNTRQAERATRAVVKERLGTTPFTQATSTSYIRPHSSMVGWAGTAFSDPTAEFRFILRARHGSRHVVSFGEQMIPSC